MAQNDIQITTTPPLPGLTLVQGINGALQSLATDFAGSIDPAAIGGVGPYCTWADTGNGLLKRRNAAGTDWVVEGKLLANNSAAENIDYDNAASGLAADNVQDAVDELGGLLIGKLDADKNIVLGTAIAATGTAIDFTGIPSTAKRITVMFNGVSTNGMSPIAIRLGDSGGVEVSDYYSISSFIQGATTGSSNALDCFHLVSSVASDTTYGSVCINKVSGNIYESNGTLARAAATPYNLFTSGIKELSDTLTVIRLTTVNGTDQFTGGTINISWE